MSWFFISLAAPLLYSASNYIDKYVLQRFVRKESGVGGIVLFSALFAVIMVPITWLFAREAISFSAASLALVLNGMVSVISLTLYLKALHKFDASAVVPLYQLIPVFSYLLGYLVLGEVLSAPQIIAGALIIIGSFILSLKLEGGRFALNLPLILWMSSASLLFALTGVIFKKLAIEGGFWPSQFWEYCGIALLGILLFALSRNYREDFTKLYRQNRGRVFAFNASAEICMIAGDLLFGFSLLLAPITLVYIVNSLQPLFVLILGIILSVLLPQYYSEIHSGKSLIQRSGAILVMIVGAVMLAIYS